MPEQCADVEPHREVRRGVGPELAASAHFDAALAFWLR
jgi:hypothetical protein